MAEIAVIGLVASIVQLADVSARAVKRLREYAANAGKLPALFRHINKELPVLSEILGKIQIALQNGALPHESKLVLEPVIDGCVQEIRKLEMIMDKTLATPSDTKAKRNMKALGSLRYDGKVEKIVGVIKSYTRTLVDHVTTSSAFGQIADPKPLIPSSNTPFRRDPHFIHRTILDVMETKGKIPASRTALVGLGGVGKSQLVVAYSYRLRDHDNPPSTWVFWVRAGTAMNFIDSYRDIAEKIQIAAPRDSTEDTLEKVFRWLSNESNGQWLMIIDNADDIAVFESQSISKSEPKNKHHNNKGIGSTPTRFPDLASYLPQSSNGHYMITSRDRQVAFRLTGNYADILHVEPMEEEESIRLFLTRFPKSDMPPESDTKELMKELDYMPLAITQAASFINQRTPRMTVKKYLEELRKGEIECGKLLNVQHFDLGRDSKRANSVIATWHISFEYLRRSHPSAARLLSHMCLFERQRIPESLCKDQYQRNPEWTTKPKWPRIMKSRNIMRKDNASETAVENFEDDLVVLRDFSLIKIHLEDDKFQMHNLVQLTTRNWLLLHGEFKWWQEKFIILIDTHWPFPDILELDTITDKHDELIPHASRALAHEPGGGNPLRSWANLLYKFAHHLKHSDMREAAMKLSRLALQKYESLYGPKDVRTLTVVHQLAMMTRHSTEKEALIRRALDGRTSQLGLEHPETIASMKLLVGVLKSSGRFEQGFLLQQETLQLQEKVLGVNHRHTQSTALWGGLWNKDYTQAEQEARLSVTKLLEWRGADDDMTHEHMSWLGVVLFFQEKYEEAKQVQRSVLEARLKKYGEDNEYTRRTATFLASILAAVGELQEAHKLFELALAGYIGPPEPDDDDAVGAVTRYADLFCKMGELEKAEEMVTTGIARTNEEYGTGHIRSADNIQVLGHIRERQGRCEEAMRLYQTAFEIARQRDHDDTPRYEKDVLALRKAIAGREAEVSEAVKTSLPETGILDEVASASIGKSITTEPVTAAPRMPSMAPTMLQSSPTQDNGYDTLETIAKRQDDDMALAVEIPLPSTEDLAELKESATEAKNPAQGKDSPNPSTLVLGAQNHLIMGTNTAGNKENSNASVDAPSPVPISAAPKASTAFQGPGSTTDMKWPSVPTHEPERIEVELDSESDVMAVYA